jgi:hypothetical protein
VPEAELHAEHLGRWTCYQEADLDAYKVAHLADLSLRRATAQRDRSSKYPRWQDEHAVSQPGSSHPLYNVIRGVLRHAPEPVQQSWRDDGWAFLIWVERHLGPRPSARHSLRPIHDPAGFCEGNLGWVSDDERDDGDASSLVPRSGETASPSGGLSTTADTRSRRAAQPAASSEAARQEDAAPRGCAVARQCTSVPGSAEKSDWPMLSRMISALLELLPAAEAELVARHLLAEEPDADPNYYDVEAG